MEVRFWGTRGSFAKPGAGTVRYGGNTSCVEVRTDSGIRIVLDCGTGGHELGRAIMAEGGPSRGHMLISHTHWDHIQGIPFFAPFFVPGHEWDIYAPQGFGESLAETLAGQMEYTYFPVTPDAFGATVRYHHLGEGQLAIGDAVIETCYLNHPALTLAFRIEADGASLVYACDHEPHARALGSGEGVIEGQDARYAEFLAGADLLIHDAQYVAAEYPAKVGWGHSTVEYAVAIARHAGVRRLALTHHDPIRTDDDIDAYLARIEAARPTGDTMEIFGAAEGRVVSLRNEQGAAERGRRAQSAVRSEPALARPLLLLATDDEVLAATVAGAIEKEPVDLLRARTADAARDMFRTVAPALAIIDDRISAAGGVALVKQFGARGKSSQVPTMILGNCSAPPSLAADTDWLQAPFSAEYARTRIRTWLMRGECHWQRAAMPEDEAARAAAIRTLGILDSGAEERFDRHTRIAAALFNVPVSLVSIVEGNRQWFKSCHGTDVCETDRDVSFCAHAVVARDALIVSDTLRDARFRDNPLVSGPPHIRFYAGVPLFLPDGHCVGTLCILDMRPRELNDGQVALLGDLGRLVESELATWRSDKPAVPLPAI